MATANIATCVHHWRITDEYKTKSPQGVCKKCGEFKTFLDVEYLEPHEVLARRHASPKGKYKRSR